MKRLIAVLGLSIAGLLTGLAHAQTSVIRACVTVSNGGVRIVSDATSCKNGEQPIKHLGRLLRGPQLVNQ